MQSKASAAAFPVASKRSAEPTRHGSGLRAKVTLPTPPTSDATLVDSNDNDDDDDDATLVVETFQNDQDDSDANEDLPTWVAGDAPTQTCFDALEKRRERSTSPVVARIDRATVLRMTEHRTGDDNTAVTQTRAFSDELAIRQRAETLAVSAEAELAIAADQELAIRQRAETLASTDDLSNEEEKESEEGDGKWVVDIDAVANALAHAARQRVVPVPSHIPSPAIAFSPPSVNPIPSLSPREPLPLPITPITHPGARTSESRDAFLPPPIVRRAFISALQGQSQPTFTDRRAIVFALVTFLVTLTAVIGGGLIVMSIWR